MTRDGRVRGSGGSLRTNATESRSCTVCGSVQRPLFAQRGHDYRRCDRCGLVSTYPIPDPATLRAHYERKFREGNYRLLREHVEQYTAGVYRPLADELERALGRGRRSAAPLSGKRVLDVGCFTGEFLGVLQERGAETYGLELQAEAVEIARRRFGDRIWQADPFDRTFPQGPFDVVTLLGVVEHVVDPVGLLGRVVELIRPGGLLFLQTPDSGSLLARAMGRLWPAYAPVEHIHLFSGRALATVLTRLGLVVEATRPHWGKKLPLRYVHAMLGEFGPQLHAAFDPIYRILPGALTRRSFPFFVGEMIVVARAPAGAPRAG